MGGVEFPSRRIAPDPTSQVGGMIRSQFTGHQGCGMGVELEVHNRLPRSAIGHAITAIGAPVDQGCVVGVSVFGAMLLERTHPSLIDKLE